MDTETIQQLITMFSELGGDAKEAFVWYLVITYAPRWIISLIWTIGVLWLLTRVISFLRMIFIQFSGLSALHAATGKSLVEDWERDEWDRALVVIREHWND